MKQINLASLLRGWLVLSLIIVVGGIETAAQQSNRPELRVATEIFEFRPGVIVSSRPRIGYLMNVRGGVDAVELSSGGLLWASNAAAKPLILHEQILVAQSEPGPREPSNRLGIVLLRAQNGDLASETSVQLPDGVRITIDDGLETSFHTSAYTHEDDVIVSWRFSEREVRGVPSPHLGEHVTEGFVRVDLETGGASLLEPDDVPAPVQAELPENVAGLVRLGTVRGPFWQVGSLVATVERSGTTGGESSILKRWQRETGQQLPDITLFGGELTYRYLSADGRHLLGSRPQDVNEPVWLWRIYSLETGAMTAEVRQDAPAAPFFVSGTSLIDVEPPTTKSTSGGTADATAPKLRAIDLKTSNVLWVRPFRDTSYRGPHPPSRSGGAGTSAPPGLHLYPARR